MIPEQALSSRNTELSNVFFILLVGDFLNCIIFLHLYLEKCSRSLLNVHQPSRIHH